MPQVQPVKIIMGLHPHAGWRSFKTSKEVGDIDLLIHPLLVVSDRRIRVPVGGNQLITDFGRQLVRHLTHHDGLVEHIRLGMQQFELFLTEQGPSWEEILPQLLPVIASVHSGTPEYVLEIRDMSVGEQRWDIEPDAEELEEIEEREDSFTVN
jgi:hypothetical protein